MSGQIYRETHIITLPNGSITSREVWRGYAENYVVRDLPPTVMRKFELYMFGYGWVEVSRPIWANSIASTNPQQGEME